MQVLNASRDLIFRGLQPDASNAPSRDCGSAEANTTVCNTERLRREVQLESNSPVRVSPNWGRSNWI